MSHVHADSRLRCANAASPEGGVDAAIYSADNGVHAAGAHAAFLVDADDDHPAFAAGRASERQAQANLLRCIFGNPFRPVTIDPDWLTWNDGTVVRLAEAIYQEGAFDRMSILADALEEAGCTDADILGHCRQPGPGVAGWLIC